MFPKTNIPDWSNHGGQFSSFYRRYYIALVGYARHSLRLNHEEADELVSLFMISQMKKSEDAVGKVVYEAYVDVGSRFRNFLKCSLRNFVASKKRKTQYTINIEESLDSVGRVDHAIAAFVSSAHINELRSRLAKRLGTNGQAYLDLKWPKEFSDNSLKDSEIARRLGESERKINLLTKKLRGFLADELSKEMKAAGFSDDQIFDFQEKYSG